MKVLITGAAGFIGSHMVDRFLSEGIKVVAIDKFAEGIGQHRLNKYNSRLITIKADIAKEIQIKDSYFKDVDWVFHLAGKSDIAPSISSPLNYHLVNVTGTINILEAARRANVKKFIYPASSSCYGIPDIYPTAEIAPIKPQNPYALTKYLGEVYTLHYGQVYKLPVIVLRLFNVYGPKVRKYGSYGPVVSIFMKQKQSGKSLTIVGDGEQTRDFTYISDVIDVFTLAAKSNITHEVFNVGNDRTYSINKLVNLIGGDKAYIPKRSWEQSRSFADISKIKKKLGWRPKVSLEEGIKKIQELENSH